MDLRFRGPLEAKSLVRGRKMDPPGAPGRGFDFKCRCNPRDCNLGVPVVVLGSFGARFEAGWGPFGPQTGPKSSPKKPNKRRPEPFDY